MQEWQDAKTAFDEAYANATDQQRAEVDGYLQSTQNYSSANPMNNRSTRQYETQVYTNALGMLQGTPDPARGATQSTANIFNGYSQRENINNANSVLSDYRKRNQQKQSYIAGTPGTDQLYFTYNWNKGLNSDWALDSDTLVDRMNSFATTLAQNLQEAKNESAKGKKLIGISNENIENALAALQGKTWSKDNFKELMQIAKNAGVSASGFRSYFGDLFPGLDPTSQKIKALQADGYNLVENGDYGEELNNLIRSKGYKVATKDGKNYLIGSDYSGPVLDARDIFFNTDWDPAKEGTGYIIGNDGSFVYGNLNQYYDDKNSPWKAQIDEYLTSLNNKDRAHWKTYNQFTDFSDLDLINSNNQVFHNRSIADMSQYFDIDSPVIATVNGDNWDKVTSKYGHVKLDDQNLTYYWVDKNGQNKSGTYQQFVQDTGAQKTLTKTTKRGDVNWEDFIPNLNQFNIADREDFFTTDANRRSGFVNFLSNNWYDQTNKDLWTADNIDADQDIGKNKDGVARMLVQLYGIPDSELTDEQKKIKNAWWDNNPQQAAWLIYNQLKNSNYSLFNGPHQQDYIRNWKMILNNVVKNMPEFATSVKSEKEGGVLKAAEGTYIDASGNIYQGPQRGQSYASNIRAKAQEIQDDREAVRERADEYGRTMGQQRASEGKWTSSDTLRATALATDIVGLIGAATGAATGGIGSAVAVGSGFASMGMDAIADFTDDKVSKVNAFKNMAVNTGLAVGAMFGAKAPKIVKSAIKLLPKAMMLVGTAGIVFDPEVQNTVKRISEGKTMNMGDWKNIITVLRTATGIATVGTVSGGTKKYAKKYTADVETNTKKLLSTTSDLDPNIKYVKKVDGDGVVKVDKKVLSEAEALLKKNDIDGAKTKLTESGVSEVDADAILNTTPNSRGYNPFKKSFWKPGETTEINTALTPQEAQLANNPSIAAQARLRAIQANQRKFNADKKRFKMMNWMDEHIPFIEQQNYYQNAALADAAKLGYSAKNIAQLRKALKAQIPETQSSKKKVAPQNETPKEEQLAIRQKEPQQKNIQQEEQGKQKSLKESIQEKVTPQPYKETQETYNKFQRLKQVAGKNPNEEIVIINDLINTLRNMGYKESHPAMQQLIRRGEQLAKIPGVLRALKAPNGLQLEIPFTRSGGNINYKKLRK